MNKAFFQSFFPEGIYVVPEKLVLAVPEESVLNEINIEEDKEFELHYLGENRQKILILVEDASDDFINSKDKDFLSKILGAIKLTFNDVALINVIQNPSLGYKEYQDKIDFRKLIIFGKEPSGLADSALSKYRIHLDKDIEILHADILNDIQEDKNKKIKLWEELKKLFP